MAPDPVTGGEGFLTTRVDAVLNWARSNSLMPMPMGLACGAIEMMAMRNNFV